MQTICFSGAGLAPMAGVTDMPFRALARACGAAFSVTEMVSAKGFLYAPKGTRAVEDLLLREPDEQAVGLQLFGHEPELMAEAAARLTERGFAYIDLNMGCPAHKIVGNGDGCALMKDPKLAARLVERVRGATPLPVTVKCRAGYDDADKNAVSFARRMADAGACAIMVHPRTRAQQYAGAADWSIIADVVQAVSCPVIGNGDIRSGDDALAMLRDTGCAAVAVGRAAQGNPWIFSEINAALAGEPYAPPSFHARIELALSHLSREIELRGETSAVLMMRKQLAWYVQGHRGAAQIRAKINQTETAKEVRALFDSALNEQA